MFFNKSFLDKPPIAPVNGTFGYWTRSGSDTLSPKYPGDDITTLGKIGAGTNTPEHPIHIEGEDSQIINIENTDETVLLDQEIGALQWKNNDTSSSAAGISGKVAVRASIATGRNYAMDFILKRATDQLTLLTLDANLSKTGGVQVNGVFSAIAAIANSGIDGSDITLQAEAGGGVSATDGGDINLYTGDENGGGTDGNIMLLNNAGHVKIQRNGSKLFFGLADEYSIEWDGSDAVHTISSGDFVFTGGNVVIGATSSTGKLEVHDGLANPLLFVDNSGGQPRVGVGTDDPDVFNSGANAGILGVMGAESAGLWKEGTLNLINKDAATIVGRVRWANLDGGSDVVGAARIDVDLDGSASATRMEFHTSGGQAMTIKASKNVGIWTILPNEALEVDGNIRLTSDNNEIQLGLDQDSTILFDGVGTVFTSPGYFTFNDGIVGIGEVGADLVARFEVGDTARNALSGLSSGANYHQIIRRDADDNNAAVALGFGISSSTGTLGAAIGHQRLGGSSQGTLFFATRGSSGGVVVRAIIDRDGNVEINDGSELRWRDVGSSNYVGFEAPALSADQIWVLPDSDGGINDHLRTDGAGNLSWQGQPDTGEFFINSSTTLTIVTTNVWHPGIGQNTGILSGMTVDDGETGAITEIVQNGSDITVTANNTMSVGDPVALIGSTGYDDLYLATAVTATTFDVTAGFVADGTGVFIKPQNFVIASAGTYSFNGSFSGLPVTGAPTFEFGVAVNDAVTDKGAPIRKFANATDTGSTGGTEKLDLSIGDRVYFVARNITGTQNLTVVASNANITRD